MMNQFQQIKNVAILANPFAGAGNADKIAFELSNKLNVLNIPNQIYKHDWPNDITLNGFSDCWIIGGDGTINYFINKYPNCKLSLALFNGGTGNDFAWKLYGDTNVNDRFEQVVKASPKYIDAGIVNNKRFINCIGIGFDGEIIQSMKAIRFLGGKVGYLFAVLYKILGFKEKYITIQTIHGTWEQKCLLALVVNSSRAGGSFYIAPDAEIDDGQLNMVLCESLPIWKRLKFLPIIKSGKHLQLPFIKHELGKEFKFNCSSEMPIQVDGELIFAKIIQVQVLANHYIFRY